MVKETVKSVLRPILTPLRPANIVMFHIGRCGSTVLSSLLRQHKNIFWASEYYVQVFRDWERANGGQEIKGEMPDDAINMLKLSMGHAMHRSYGFEIKPFHFQLIGYSMETFVDKLEKLGFTHYIILDRKNRLRKIVSSALAHADRVKYHQGKEAGAKLRQVHLNVENIKIDYDSKPLLKFLSDYDREFASLAKLLEPKNYLSLTYEEDVQEDPRLGYRKICEYTGLRSKDISAQLSRTNPFPVKDMIENFEEVEELLKGTDYEWMLYD